MIRQHGGLGIGLALVRHIAELHGGVVAATSEGEGKGATFTVRLPVHVEAPQVTRSGAEDGARSIRNVKVLLVEDDAEHPRIRSKSLERNGATVVAVELAIQALDEIPLLKAPVLHDQRHRDAPARRLPALAHPTRPRP